MKILRLRAYYDPEKTAGSHLDHDLCRAFMDNDIQYVSYTPYPTRGITREEWKLYKKRRKEILYNGYVIINRFSMFREGKKPIQRAIRYAACTVKEYFLGIKETDIDLVYSSSTPPTQGMLSALVAKRLSQKIGKRVPFVYNLQDIFPDSLVNAKMTKQGSLIWKIGRKIEDYTYRAADKIIVISEDFKRNIMEKGVPEDKIVVIPNWVDTQKVFPVERKNNVIFDRYNLDRNHFYVCYSGNIGHSQNMRMLLNVAKELRISFPDIVFMIIGEGATKTEMEEVIRDERIDNVIILPFQPYEDISHVFSLGDVGLIISKPGIGGSSIPSKAWGIMAAERPVLCSFDDSSALSRLIKNVGCGIAVPAEDGTDNMKKAIIALYNEREKNDELGALGRKYVTEYIAKDKCVGMLVQTVIREASCRGEKRT